MGVRFVLGRAGSGKSAQVLDELRGELQRAPEGDPLLLLVPEQATFQMEHALVSTPGIGGLLRAQVLSFRRLAWRVMQETGGTAGIPIDDTGKAMLMTKLLHAHREELRWFAGSADKLGEVGRLVELLAELKRYCVTPDRLSSWLDASGQATDGRTRQLQDKLHDLNKLAGAFERELAGQYLDGDDFLTRLAERLPEAGFLRGAELWIDGFFGFTPQEQAAVVALCRHTRRVTLTLTLDRPYAAGEQPHELNLFYPTAMTMIRLLEALADVGIDASQVETVQLPDSDLPRFRTSPALAHLEREYERRLSPHKRLLPSPPAGHPGLTVAQATNRRAEVEAAARELVRLAREEGLRWREMAVRVRNLEAYGDLLAAVFKDYGIPFFMDQKRSVLHHPLPELIRSALETVLQRWRYEPVFRGVRTGFFGPLPEEGTTAAEAEALERAVNRAFDSLENYVLAYGIQGSRWHDPRSWRLTQPVSLEDGSAKALSEVAQARLEASRQAVSEPLGSFDLAFGRATNAREMATALFGLLTELQVPERLALWSRQALAAGQAVEAREHEQVWDRVVDVLDQLVELLGEEPLEKRLFADLIETGLESIRLGLVPVALDQVLIGSIDRTRSAQVRVSFLLGASDGELPARPKEDGPLSEQERERLVAEGLTLADGSRRRLLDESFLIYTVLCAPSASLWLSYPLSDEEGATLLPSELIGQIRSLFPGLPVLTLAGEPQIAEGNDEVLPYLADEGRALSYLTVQLREWLKGRPIAGLWWSVYNRFATLPAWRERLNLTVRSLAYANEARRLDERTSLALYGDRLQASVSRMERFVECPFSQFVSHGLRLRERRLHRLEAPDIGQLYHAALKWMVERMYGEGQAGARPLSEADIAAAATAVVDELAPRLQNEILLSSSRFQYIAGRLRNTIQRAATMLAEHAQQGAFAPVGLELGFGPGEPLPALTYRLPNGRTMDIVGRIDRVDKAEADQGLLLRVIDYKSSRTALQLSEVYYGLSLQMLTYLDVLLTHAERWLGRKALPAGVLYFHVHNPLLSSKNALPPGSAEAEARKQLRMKGMVRADVETVRLMDEGLRERSGASELIDVALTKDGGFHKRSLVASDPQWDGLRSYVREVIGQIGTELTGGNVAIAPYRIGQETPCTHCAYKPVCAFDPLVPGNRYQTLRKPGKEELWLAFAEAGAGKETGLRIRHTEEGGTPHE